MQKIGGQEPPVVSNDKPWAASRMRSTLAAYYERKRWWLKEDFPGFYDTALRQIFTITREDNTVCKASQFLRSQKRQIINSVSRWTGQRKYDIAGLIKKLAKRCDEMGLYLNRADTMFDITAFVTAVMCNSVQLIDRVERK